MLKAYYNEKSGRFRCRGQETYKGITWTNTGTSLKSAAEAKKAYKANKEAKIAEIDGDMDRKTGKVKLKDAMPEWYDTFERNKLTNGRPRSERTVETDESTMKMIIAELGDYQVRDITTEVLQKHFNKIASQAGRGGSTSTLRKQWIILSRFFKKYYQAKSPMIGCIKPATQQDKDKQMEKIEMPAYTDEEMVSLTDALNAMDGDRADKTRAKMLTLILWAFLRVGEAIELRVKDIDFVKGVIHITRQYDESNKKVTAPKDNSKRDIPIPWRCKEMLIEMCDGKEAEDLVFRGDCRAQDYHLLRSATLHLLQRACEIAGIERHRTHDLRHDGISYYVRHGAKPETIQRWAGHSHLTVTMDLYYRNTKETDPHDLALISGPLEKAS